MRRQFKTVPVSLTCLVLLAHPVLGAERPAKSLVDDDTRQQLTTYLTDLCDWIMTLDVGSGDLKGTADTEWSIFINGNLARTLLAAHKITNTILRSI